MNSSLHLHNGNTQKKVLNIASDEDIMENNYMFVMLWNSSVISHLIFPRSFFFLFLAQNLKITTQPFKGGYLDFSHLTEFKNIYTTNSYENQSTDSTEGQEIEDVRQHKRSDKVNLNIRPSTVTLTLGISN